MNPTRLVTALAVTAALTLAGCSDDPEPKLAPAETQSRRRRASSQPSRQSTELPAREAPSRCETFVSVWVECLNHALTTGDPAQLRAAERRPVLRMLPDLRPDRSRAPTRTAGRSRRGELVGEADQADCPTTTDPTGCVCGRRRRGRRPSDLANGTDRHKAARRALTLPTRSAVDGRRRCDSCSRVHETSGLHVLARTAMAAVTVPADSALALLPGCRLRQRSIGQAPTCNSIVVWNVGVGASTGARHRQRRMRQLGLDHAEPAY